MSEAAEKGDFCWLVQVGTASQVAIAGWQALGTRRFQGWGLTFDGLCCVVLWCGGGGGSTFHRPSQLICGISLGGAANLFWQHAGLV